MLRDKAAHEFKIRLRDDGVYDLYIDNAWLASKSHYEEVLNTLEQELLKYNNDANFSIVNESTEFIRELIIENEEA